MKYSLKIGLGLFVLLGFLWACNPAKNTTINRFYHSTTAQYNGYFNANLLLDQAITGYRKNAKEDYYNLIPFEQYPNETEVIALYPSIDTAIAKCTKVIGNHSMPGADRPSAKKEENNNFIDENWTTIGIASYMRRDYSVAMKNFQFIKKFYKNDPSNYIGELWMAKTNIALEKYTEAGFNLETLQNALDAEAEAAKKSKGFKGLKEKFKKFTLNKRKRKKNKKLAESEAVAKFPKKILFDFYQTKAELLLVKGETDLAIENLELAVKETRKKPKKARVYYILAQLNQKQGNLTKAKEYYSKVLKNNAPFEMEFSARMKRALMGADSKLEKELKKMLRDSKNAEFKDQIYYALAQIDLQKPDEAMAFSNLTSSAFYSVSNNRQKAMAYEQLGDMKFKKRDYIPAQKYYDSCSISMPENYPNFDGIKNKAAKLKDLVVAVETAIYEDSVLRIASMNESDRTAFLDKTGKQLKVREENRKKQEAEKLLALQKNEGAFNQKQSGNKWYFRNAKTRTDGFNEFKRMWGVRENEDDWRRSEKINLGSISEEGDTMELSLETDSAEVKIDPFGYESLIANIPLDDSAQKKSQEKLVKALYTSGLIYKDQLKEDQLASVQFEKIIDQKFETDYKLMAAYQLFKINETSNTAKAEIHKNYILNYYPNSDYANYIRDPDYFLKKKELDARAETEYVEAVNRYRNGLYYPALTRSETVITTEPTNEFRAKYLLLKAMCQGKLNDDKKTLLPTLNQIITEFPGSTEATRAEELLGIIQNGYSKNEPAEFEDKSLYKYVENEKLYVLVFLEKEDNSGLAKSKVVDFNKEFFSRDRLKVSSKIYGDDQSVVFIEEFETESAATKYARVFKATRKHLLDLQKAKTVIISQENLKVLFQTKKLQEYEDFYDEYY